MKPAVTFIILLVLVFLDEYQVTGRCVGDDANVANTNWAACLVAENNEENGNCPHGFPKIENVICGWGHSRIPAFKNLVCCVVSPVIDIKIKQSPCVAGSPSSNDKIRKKNHRYH